MHLDAGLTTEVPESGQRQVTQTVHRTSQGPTRLGGSTRRRSYRIIGLDYDGVEKKETTKRGRDTTRITSTDSEKQRADEEGGGGGSDKIREQHIDR